LYRSDLAPILLFQAALTQVKSKECAEKAVRQCAVITAFFTSIPFREEKVKDFSTTEERLLRNPLITLNVFADGMEEFPYSGNTAVQFFGERLQFPE
jgi:hypothetical protein